MAVATLETSRNCTVRLTARLFTLSVRSFQVPMTPRTSAWPPSLPSVPTSFATRVTSAANELSWSTMTLTVFLSSRISPRASTVIFWLRSPLATAVVTRAMFRTWLVRLLARPLTLSVRSFQVPLNAAHFGLAAQFAFGTHFARHAGDFGGERGELVHHGVHRGADAEEFALHRRALDLQRHFLGQVAFGHSGDNAGDLGGGPRQVFDERVDGIAGERPRAARIGQRGPLGHAAFAADGARHALDFIGHALVEANDIVEGAVNLAELAIGRRLQAHGEVAVFGGAQGV